MFTLSSNTLWLSVVETGLSDSTGYNLCVNMCGLPPPDLWFWSIYQEAQWYKPLYVCMHTCGL